MPDLSSLSAFCTGVENYFYLGGGGADWGYIEVTASDLGALYFCL
jgi:hypothetical protein